MTLLLDNTKILRIKGSMFSMYSFLHGVYNIVCTITLADNVCHYNNVQQMMVLFLYRRMASLSSIS